MFQIVAKSKTEADIQLYGGISTWDNVRAKDVTNLLNKAKSDGYSKINLRIHSPGGSVTEGLAIYNAIQNLGVQVVAYIDGIAASMASIIMLAADEVYASKLARVMTHQARVSCVNGTATQLREVATQLDTTNEQFAELYVTKTGKEKKWVMENLLPDGKDVWFTAKQALEAGLIDKIVEPPVKIDTTKKAESDLDIIALYDEAFCPVIEANNVSNSNSNNHMEIKLSRQQALLLLTALGVSMQAQASLKDEVIPEMLLEKAEAIKAKLAEYDTLKAQLQKTENDKVLEAVKAKGGTKEQQDKYVALVGKLGLEATLELVNDLPAPQDLVAAKTTVKTTSSKGFVSNPNGRTYEQWAKETPEDLLRLMEQEPERYAFLADNIDAKL